MNRDEEANDIDARLAALPRPTMEAAVDERIHARARQGFLTSHANVRAELPSGPWKRLWNRLLEPAAVAIAVLVYLIWTAQALAAIDWGRLPMPSMDRVGSTTAPRAAGGRHSE